MNDVKTYLVKLVGCDETNEVSIPLKDAELEVVRMIAHILNENSSFSCEPRMFVEEGDQGGNVPRS